MTTLRIAFTSCFSTAVFEHTQPVWNDIAGHNPDVLVLLGDSIYIDCPHPLGPAGGPTHPADLSAFEFAAHLHRLYQRQLAVEDFRKLVTKPNLRTFAIWDDHDFLWNDALRPNLTVHGDHAFFSANLFRCWRESLSGSQKFPTTTSDPRVNVNTGRPPRSVNYDQAMPGYQYEALANKQVLLHLTDGRSWRDQSTLLGLSQRNAIEKVMDEHPHALHLLASGSTLEGKGTSGWKAYPDDLAWLERMAARYNVVVLSGDIHKNGHMARRSGAKWLQEFTASGAAVDFAPRLIPTATHQSSPLTYERHFGLLTIQNGKLTQAQLFHLGQPGPAITVY